jgi:hypothetical protein
LNGASECEAGVANTGANREQDSSIPGLLLLTNQTINANNETRVNIEGSETKDIPKVGFNYDNVNFCCCYFKFKTFIFRFLNFNCSFIGFFRYA